MTEIVTERLTPAQKRFLNGEWSVERVGVYDALVKRTGSLKTAHSLQDLGYVDLYDIGAGGWKATLTERGHRCLQEINK